MIARNQMSMADIFSDCHDILENDKPEFLSLLDTYIDLDEIVPSSFKKHFYAHTGRPREYSLESMLWALIIQKIFSIPTDTLLLTFLRYSRHLRQFCGFDKLPDPSKITRFKQDFVDDIQLVFDRLVDLTEPICQAIDPELASMTIYDSTGIEAYVQENNPKFLNTVIRSMTSFAKAQGLGDWFDPHKAAYAKMPSSASAESQVKQLYINGHFCYAYEAGIVTNGLGIPRAIEFYDENYFEAHPEIVREKKSSSPDEDKSVKDSKLLIPTLKDFFEKHPSIQPEIFLGDSSFDAIQLYKDLLTGDTFGKNRHFSKAFIPLNSRGSTDGQECPLNEHGVPCCPHDPTLPMKPEGNTSHLRCGMPTFKFVCPKMTWDKCDDGKYHRVCHCDDPCTDSKSGRMTYIYPERNLRLYPGTIRGTDEWIKTYKIRTAVERDINHFKGSCCIGDRKSRNARTIHADLLIAGISQLMSVLLAGAMHKHQYVRTVKQLVCTRPLSA